MEEVGIIATTHFPSFFGVAAWGIPDRTPDSEVAAVSEVVSAVDLVAAAEASAAAERVVAGS